MHDGYIESTARIGAGCKIGRGVIIHHNVVIYEGVSIGDNTEIFDNAVIGRPPRGTGITVSKIENLLEPLSIGENCVVGSCAVIYSGSRIGDSVLIGDGCQIREGANVGNRVLIAANVTINHHTTVRDNSKIMDLAHITSRTVIEENVFIAPGVITVNDNSMRISGSPVSSVMHIMNDAKIGAGAVILPDKRIGEGAVVSAQSVVTRDVDDSTVVVGVPARVKKEQE